MAEFTTSEEVLQAINDYEGLLQIAEQQCNFLEADKAATTIDKLKEEYEKKLKEEEGDQQRNQMVELSEAHEKELRDHNDEWEDKLKEYEEYTEQCQERLIAKQAEQLEAEKERLEQKIPMKPKPSLEWLNLNKIKANVIKAKNYKEAHYAQQRQLQIEAESQAKWDIKRQEKINQELSKLQIAHVKEMENLEKRLKSGYIELCQKREKLYNQRIRTFNNGMREMQMIQRIDRAKAASPGLSGRTSPRAAAPKIKFN